jgi:hypothetical protein
VGPARGLADGHLVLVHDAVAPVDVRVRVRHLRRKARSQRSHRRRGALKRTTHTRASKRNGTGGRACLRSCKVAPGRRCLVCRRLGRRRVVSTSWTSPLGVHLLAFTFWCPPFGVHLLVSTFWCSPFDVHLLVFTF